MRSAGKMAGGRGLQSIGRRPFRTPATTVAVLLAVLVSSFPQSAPADDLDSYRTAVGFYKKDEWKLAAESFQAFLKNHGQHPKAENAKFYYGLTLVKLDDFKQAREVLRGFVKDYPKSRELTIAGYWIGHSSYFLDDFADAEKELSRFVAASAQDPLLEWALPYLADAELRLKKPEAAAQHFQRALDSFPKGEMVEDARFGLGRSYELLKKLPEAIKAYQEVAANRAGSRAADAQLNLGDLHFDSGDYAAAAADFEVFEQRFPESPQLAQAQFNRGSALYQLREHVKAAQSFDQASKAEKYAAEALFWKGLSFKAVPDLAQAVAVFKAAYEKYRDQPLAEKLLFQWAQCEDRRGGRDQARQLYVDLVGRWPKGNLAHESLYAATLAAVDTGKVPEAEALIARFDKEYAASPLRLRQEILKGRLLMVRPEHDFAGAAKLFQNVISASEKEGTKQQARYYLGYALQNQGQHAKVLEVTEPLTAQIAVDKSLTEYAGVFVFRAESQRALARAAAAAAKPGDAVPADVATYAAVAVMSAKKYLELVPNGPLTSQALAVAAMSEALAARKEPAQQYLDALRKGFAESPEFERTLLELGKLAFARDDYPFAERLYGELAARPKSPLHAEALADLGWSLHRQKKHLEAAAAFGRVLTEHAGDKLVPEAAFQRGIALSDGGKTADAQVAFAEAAKLPGESKEVFLAGWQSARLLGRLKKSADADAAFDALVKRFPKSTDGDKVLNEWAMLHYDAQNYARGDEIFRRLVADYQQSALAGNARLSLAESDLIAGRTEQAKTQFIALASASVPVAAGAEKTAEQKQQASVLQQRALYQLIQIELGAKRWEAVRKYCDESQQRFPEGSYRFENDLSRAEADFNLGDFKGAQERLLALKARKDQPELRKAKWFPQVWVMLAEIEWRLRAHEAVAVTVAEFRAWDPKSSLLYQADEVLGRSLKSQSKWSEARTVLQRVLDDPNSKDTETAAKSLFLIADTYFWEKNYEAAYKHFLEVDIRYNFPDLQASALYQAGVCQEELQAWKKAARSYDEMLQKYPSSEHASKARERLEFVRKRIASG
ncbi:MAG: tetratricopeptide repeat protein [Planctomycetia bacterium]|nr:tetratricopeptide repeat protein [Planctomycetia bacterium]